LAKIGKNNVAAQVDVRATPTDHEYQILLDPLIQPTPKPPSPLKMD